MKKVTLLSLLLICLCIKPVNVKAQDKLLTQQEFYANLWTEVDTLLARKVNADSIISMVDSIKSVAEKQGNLSNITKTIYYKAVIISNFRVKGRYEAITYIESELKIKDGIIVPLLQSILADFYIKLRDDYSYSSNKQDSLTSDIKQWSRKQLDNKINDLLTLSMNNEQTKAVDILLFKDFFDGNAFTERTTLFDYLTYYTIKNCNRNYNGRRLVFNPSLYSVDKFLSSKTPDDTILAYYYNLLKFHQQRNDSRAFVHAEISRLKELPRLVENSWRDNLDSLYILSLEKLNSKYEGADAQVEIIAELVTFYWDKSTSWYIDYTKPINLVRCKRLLDKALLRNISSPAYEKCENLKKNFTASYLKVELDQEHYPQTKISAKINSKNISTIDVTIKGEDFTSKSTIPILITKKYCSQYDTITLSEGLPTGKYDLLIYGGVDTDTIKVPIVVSTVLSFGVTLNDSLIGVVVDRKTGLSVPDMPVFIKEKIWNHSLAKDTTIFSDKQGFYYCKWPDDRHLLMAKIDSVNGDIWIPRLEQFDRCLIFTDRSIYRPGQTVQYKATIINQDKANNFYPTYKRIPHLVLSNRRIVYDDHPNFLESLDGKSKIVYGKFLIPVDAALGEAIIGGGNSDYRDNKIIHVEEYKRPSFEVSIDSVIWDESKKMSCIAGNARAYVGYAIDSAKVMISIKSPVDTTIGCYTNEEGTFKSDIATNEHYYNIEVSVTSKSGETQSNKYNGSVTKAFSVDLRINDTISIPNPDNLIVHLRNGLTRCEIVIERLVNDNYIEQASIPVKGDGYSNISIERGIKSCGNYRISCKTTEGKLISTKLIVVISKEDTRQVYLDKQEYSIGDTALLTIRTPKDAQSFLFIEKNGKLWKNVLVDTTLFQYSFPITRYEQIAYRVVMTSNFKTTENSGFINISENSTKLKIEFLTYRNKLLPNSDEKWSIKVTDSFGKPVIADVTAAMYDASLDSYYPNVWLKNGLFFKNRLFSNIDFLRNKYTKETISAWNEETNIRYGSLFSWSLKPTKASYTKISIVKYPEFSNMEISTLDLPEEIEEIDQPKYTLSNTIFQDISARKNIGETIFFYPDIKTDSLGCADINFTMNEALTRWRLMLFALSKDMHYGFSDSYYISQKPLMVKPNPPRFLREGDRCYFVASIINLSDSVLNGTTSIEFFDLQTKEVLNSEFLKETNFKAFNVYPGKTSIIQWEIEVPNNERISVGYRVKAACDAFSDGEENALPILSNRELFTESFSFDVAARSNDKYTFKSFKNNLSNTSENHTLSFDLVKNPVWEALSALPYLMTYPYGCSEQKMSKLYANIIALTLLENNKDVRSVFESWKRDYKDSPLNEDSKLNATLMEESPWYNDKSTQRRRQAELSSQFSTEQLRTNISKTIMDIKKLQLPNGGFSWMPGGAINQYITQLITEKILHLQNLGIDISKYGLDDILKKSETIVQSEFINRYNKLKIDIEQGKDRYEANHLSSLIIHQLYINSFIKNSRYSDTYKEAHQFYLNQCITYFDQYSIACQGMIALALYRSGDTVNAEKIMEILNGKAYKDESLGMSWDYAPWYWYTQPIESQSIMIEAFHEIKNDKQTDALLKRWLLKNKEANRWISTKATASAIYALLMVGDKMPVKYEPFEIMIGKENLYVNEMESKSGYIHKQWIGTDIEKSKASIKIENPNDYQTWGSMTWQYFENIEKAGASENESLSLHKTMFKEVAGQKVQLNDSSIIHVGDKITICLAIEAKRDMEYVFLKDYRCSGFEPGKELSGYKWDNGFSYFESFRDASTQFFFDKLKSGKYTIEYSLYANLKGSYNNGYANIECMYAPFIRSRTQSMLITIEGDN